LLAKLGVDPPYLLVGHSWGGALARYHAAAYPDDIAGILYLDPTDVTLTERDQIAIFESFGAGEAAYTTFTRLMETAMASAPGPIRSESDVILGILRSDPETREPGAMPDVPVSVIVAGRVNAPPQGLVPFDAQRYADAMQQSQVRRLGNWVRGAGRFHVARNAGHFVHADDPRLVIDEVRWLLAANR
jgi:pimeloyl-ACP methyl ester carboxylesterase